MLDGAATCRGAATDAEPLSLSRAKYAFTIPLPRRKIGHNDRLLIQLIASPTTRFPECSPCESSSATPSKPHHIEQIAAAAPDAEVVDAGQERIAEELFAADIFCGHAKVPVDWDGVVRQGRLRWIQSSAAGMDHCLVPSVIESDIVVTSASGVLADQVAEHTIALIRPGAAACPCSSAPSRRRSSSAGRRAT